MVSSGKCVYMLKRTLQSAFFRTISHRTRCLATEHESSRLLSYFVRSFSSISRLERIRYKKQSQPRREVDDNVEKQVNSFIEQDAIDPSSFVQKDTVDLINTCCKLRSIKGMQLAHDIVDRLLVEKRRLHNDGVFVAVTIDAMQALVYGWGQLADKEKVAHKRMEEVMRLAVHEALLDEAAMTDFVEFGPAQKRMRPLSQPKTSFFNAALLGLAKGAKNTPGLVHACDRIRGEMMKYEEDHRWFTTPNTRTFTHIIEAYASSKSRESAASALRLLGEMQKLQATQLLKYEQEFRTAYDFDRPNDNERRVVHVDIVAYTSVLKAISASCRRLEDITTVVDSVEASELLDADMFFYTVAIRACANLIRREGKANKRYDIAEMAEKMMRKALKITDGSESDMRFVYNACLDAWAQSHVKEGALRCEILLQEMLEQDSVVKPNRVSFNTCIQAWARAVTFHPDAADKAHQLLSLQQELTSELGPLGAGEGPDAVSFTKVINAYAKSDMNDRLIRARNALETFVSAAKDGNIAAADNFAAPFSAVIAAAARSPSSMPIPSSNSGSDPFTETVETFESAFAVAEKTYEEVCLDTYEMGTVPNHHVFSAFLRCIAKHTALDSSEREHKVQRTFEEACLAGELSGPVMEGIELSLGGSLLAVPELREQAVPEFWSRNVPREFKYKAKGKK